jgi:glycosyltransferase involved in cell wall biosynthesis
VGLILITVVIASYRYGHLAAHCIESIFSQSIKPNKILFVDDAAKDCSHLPSLYPEIEYVMRDTNYGTVDNFQDMLMRVDTEYCMFLGADNWLRSDAFERMYAKILQENCDIITYDVMMTGQLKETRSMWHLDEIRSHQGDIYWNRENKHHGSMLYRTRLGKEIGYKKRIESNSQTEEDWRLWDRMIAKGAKVSYIPEALLYYRCHKQNNLKYDKSVEYIATQE